MRRKLVEIQPIEIQPIEFTLNLRTTPGRVYKILTSQTELRKWWAQKVVNSRNTVHQEPGRMIQMKLLEAIENELVRYSWLPSDAGPRETGSLISFRINDLTAERSNNADAEGVSLEICHDNWTNLKERSKQEQIWSMAVENLKYLCDNYPKTSSPWWENRKSENEYIQLKLLEIKIFIEQMCENIFEEDMPSRNIQKNYKNYRQFSRAIYRACGQLDCLGEWLMDVQNSKLEFRIKGAPIFHFCLNGGLLEFTWKDLESIIQKNQLADLAERLSVEQEQKMEKISKIRHASFDDVNISMSLLDLKLDMWVRWCRDLSLYTL